MCVELGDVLLINFRGENILRGLKKMRQPSNIESMRNKSQAENKKKKKYISKKQKKI